MENKNIFLGKIQKNKCFVNDGKYGYFLTCDKKNYKIPEWLPIEKVDLELATNYIKYKNDMELKYKKTEACHANHFIENEDEEQSDDEPLVKEMVLTKINIK